MSVIMLLIYFFVEKRKMKGQILSSERTIHELDHSIILLCMKYSFIHMDRVSKKESMRHDGSLIFRTFDQNFGSYI